MAFGPHRLEARVLVLLTTCRAFFNFSVCLATTDAQQRPRKFVSLALKMHFYGCDLARAIFDGEIPRSSQLKEASPAADNVRAAAIIA